MTDDQSRRQLLLGLSSAPAVAVVAGVALPATAAAQTVPQAWRDLIKQCGAFPENGHLAATRAYLAGLDVEDFSGLVICVSADGRTVPRLTFGEWDAGKSYLIVTPDTLGRYVPTEAWGRWMAGQRALPG